jgi:hypothetical protein
MEEKFSTHIKIRKNKQVEMTEIEKSQYIKYKPQWILLVDSIKVKKE